MTKYQKKKLSKMERVVRTTAVLMVIVLLASVLMSLAVSFNIFI